ncbi:MAG TPA: 4-hydroxyphenylpyruvate dioxygenase [Pyrinomonadaceae bacterium]|nr:4-hydroxyphenylpyruvate dioxygenase [Pyrinomonadaceae bacterium]
MITEQEVTRQQAGEAVRLKGIDYIELYVGNVPQAAHFYRTAFGFTPVAYAGLETGERDRLSVALRQNDVRLLLTSGLTPDGPVAAHVNRHGDSVKDIAFAVDDAEAVFEAAVSRGARPVAEPEALEDEQGRVVRASVAAFGDTVHSFVERADFGGPFLPAYRPVERAPAAAPAGLLAIDHVAVSAEAGTLDRWVDFYETVFGFAQTHEEEVETEYSAMNSKVVQNRGGSVKFPIVVPASGKRRSQVDEYLTFHGGAGAQHVALSTDSITRAVRTLRANGIEFLKTPGSYYDLLEKRLGKMLAEDEAELRELNILADRDAHGYLLQIFTRHVQSRPTVFWEIIQREGAVGFGGGNIKALFEAMEREQALRQTL